MPGSNPRALAKARTLPADGLIFDLEDAVAPDAKVTARAQVLERWPKGAMARGKFSCGSMRKTAPGGMTTFSPPPIPGRTAFCCPKVESADHVLRLELGAAGRQGAGRSGYLVHDRNGRWGVLNVASIAAASPRLGGFVMGTSDLAQGSARGAHAFAPSHAGPWARGLLAARAYVWPFSMVFISISTTKRLRLFVQTRSRTRL